MINWIEHLIGGPSMSRRLRIDAVTDHIELTPSHLVIGLKLDWRNRTREAITIKDLRVKLFRPDDAPLMLYPLERFEHLPRIRAKKPLKKTPLSPFTLPPHITYTEQIRFLSQEALDIAPGEYTAEIQIEDSNNHSYTQETQLELESRLKYCINDEWYGN